MRHFLKTLLGTIDNVNILCASCIVTDDASVFISTGYFDQFNMELAMQEYMHAFVCVKYTKTQLQIDTTEEKGTSALNRHGLIPQTTLFHTRIVLND